ncbi:hypothetical protein SteCoe_3640 [Stentor coeruleus]|uniref:Uncharacterized protein n=1 Tax=Stentor coeruleus TaxID=5963 RepID=A0A1R2CWK2_9CILI|nr:hypothetical protein SteCoe_3640 [Stentor coeruleus]
MDSKYNSSFGSIDSPTMIVINKDYNSITESSVCSGTGRNIQISNQSDYKEKKNSNGDSHIKEIQMLNKKQSPESSDNDSEFSKDLNEDDPVVIKIDEEIYGGATADTSNNNKNPMQKVKFPNLIQQNPDSDFHQVFIREKSKIPKKTLCEKICSCCVSYNTTQWKAFNQLAIAPISYFPNPSISFADFLSDLEPNHMFFLSLQEKINEIHSNILQGPSSGLSIYLLYFYKQRFPFHVLKIYEKKCEDLPEKWTLAVKNTVQLTRDNKKTRTKNEEGIIGVVFKGFVVYFTEICLKGSRVKKSLEVVERDYEKIEYNETLELD